MSISFAVAVVGFPCYTQDAPLRPPREYRRIPDQRVVATDAGGDYY
jgi:hypothetical protein